MPYNLSIRGWMTEKELRVIENLATKVPDNEIIVEIGSMLGRTAYCWAATKPNCKVICFDQWAGDSQWSHNSTLDSAPREGDFNTLEAFISNTRELKNIIPIVVTAPIFPDIDAPYLVFVDVSHYNPCDWETIQHFLPKIKKGGILCGHDYTPEFPDVVDNVRNLEKMLNQEVTLYENTTLWSFNVK